MTSKHVPKPLICAVTCVAALSGSHSAPAAPPESAHHTVPTVSLERGTPTQLTWQHGIPVETTGPTHAWQSVTFQTSTGALQLTTPWRSGPVPIFEHVETVGNDEYIVLGWSSGGAGLQTNHAVFVSTESEHPQVLDHLQLRTARGRGDLFVRRTEAGQLQIGVLVPEAVPDLSWTLRTEHNSMDEPKLLTLDIDPSDSSLRTYAPPFHLTFGRSPSDTVAWFSTTNGGFQWPAPAPSSAP